MIILSIIRANGVLLNGDKTQHVFFTLNTCLKLTVQQHLDKFLDVFVYSKLTWKWKPHIDFVAGTLFLSNTYLLENLKK